MLSCLDWLQWQYVLVCIIIQVGRYYFWFVEVILRTMRFYSKAQICAAYSSSTLKVDFDFRWALDLIDVKLLNTSSVVYYVKYLFPKDFIGIREENVNFILEDKMSEFYSIILASTVVRTHGRTDFERATITSKIFLDFDQIKNVTLIFS